jgi:hypothetical protein
MTFREFFTETDRMLNLMPIYYLNLKRFKLTCGYFEPTQSITKLYDELHQQNDDKNNEEYYCLFQKYEIISKLFAHSTSERIIDNPSSGFLFQGLIYNYPSKRSD